MINFDADWEHEIDLQVEGPDPDEVEYDEELINE